jgi:sugar (pentulose or hexulose) kinase
MASQDDLIAGIDVGTSSAKVVCTNRSGDVVKARKHYRAADAPHLAWYDAIKECLSELKDLIDLRRVQALSIASQINTYILYSEGEPEEGLLVLDWTSRAGQKQLEQIRTRFDDDYFLRHISMRHPGMLSYPLARLRYLKDTFADRWRKTEKIMQPKDYLYHKLTGVFASDPFTWRGLSNIESSDFSKDLLADNEIPRECLPALQSPFSAPGNLVDSISKELFIDKPVPVYLGCNDFFAALLGMGIVDVNQYFDVMGTSEHIGTIVSSLEGKSTAISGPFFRHFVKYGVTSSSGVCLDWARRNLAAHDNDQTGIPDKSRGPIFLPYLRGERAPVWDGKTSGVFFGLTESDDTKSLAYSVKEGVAFSLYHIWKKLQIDRTYNHQGIRVGGAGAADEASADALVKLDHEIKPNPQNKNRLMERFRIFQELYPALRELFHQYYAIGGKRDE